MEKIVAAEQSLSPVKSIEISLPGLYVADAAAQVRVFIKLKQLERQIQPLTPVFTYIDDHYAEAITLKDLSELLGVTPQHLCTLFRKIMNTRIFEFINLVRIKKSKEYLLSQPSLAIRDVAHLNGFEDVSYFCYIFKRIEKTTPGDFRKLYTRG